MVLFALATLATRADEAGGPPPTKFYELRDNLLLIPPVREFFALAPPNPGIVATALGGSLLSLVALYLSGFTPGAAASLAPAARS